MRIQVNGKYTFECDEEVRVGDEVLCPSEFSGDWVGKVTALEGEYETSYSGPVKKIISVLTDEYDDEEGCCDEDDYDTI